MTNTKRLATIFILTAILITGSLNAIQYAYSSGPDTLIVKYSGPIADDPAETIIQIYKKIDDFSNPPLDEISIDAVGDEFMVISLNYGKDKLNSNTVFRVIERTSGSDDVEIDVVEIHTSCSKPLYKGQIVDGQVFVGILEVVDGTLGSGDENSILPNNADEKCLDNKDSKHIATITLKKAITNDNGGEITDQFTENFLPKIDGVDVSFGEPIPITSKEPHIITEADVDGYSFVLIAGDTDCPSMLGEEFTVKKNKEITCTIYNDDKGDGTSGGDGIAFGFNGLQFTNPIGGIDSCISTGNVPPCVERQGPLFVIVDPLLSSPNNSLVLWSLTPPAGSPITQVNNCALSGVYPASFDASINGFGLFCSTFIQGTWNINYAFVLT